MAIVGPITSFVLAGAFWGLTQLVQNQQSPLAAMLTYLALINAILASFNLIPGFPLDGGRVLRSILWGTTGNLVRATNIAATVGRFFGWGLIAFGFLQLFTGNFLGGIWLAFIGWFLSSTADASRREVTLREQLSAVRVKEAMNADPSTISPDTTVAELVSSIFRRDHGRAVPVCQDSRILGIVTVTDVKDLPQAEWAKTPVRKIMTREPLHSVTPEDDLNTALKLITKQDINQVLVLKDGKCTGLLGRGDILSLLQLSHELGLKTN
jgi:CBS domain-containing protein